MRLHAQEDGVGGQAGETALQVRLAPKFLSLCIEVVQRPDSLLKLLPVDLHEKCGLAVTPGTCRNSPLSAGICLRLLLICSPAAAACGAKA